MITSADDTLWHTTPTTFDHAGTSDPRFFDRYWFGVYDPDGGAAVQITLGAYRNMDVMDAGVAVVRDGAQHNLRASRALGPEIETRCGPVRIEVTESLREFRLLVDGSTQPIGADLRWQAATPPEEEEPHFERSRRRVVQDYLRFNQIGVVEGWVQVAGERIPARDWWGCRDHSWGVRPGIGVPEPATGPARPLSARGFAMAFLFFSTRNLSGHVHLQQRSGDAPYVTGVVRERDGSGAHRVESVTLDADLHPGTRRFRACTITARLPDGEPLELRAEALGSSFAMQGLGYSRGFTDGRGLGAWRGDSHVEADTWDVSHPATIRFEDGRAKDHWHRIQPVRVTAGGRGRPADYGTGSLTLVLSGHLPEFGLPL